MLTGSIIPVSYWWSKSTEFGCGNNGGAIDLHKIHKVLVLDHRDCGAYKVILGEDFAKEPTKETAVHATQLKRLGKMIQEKYPALAVELRLMALDGKVEGIS
jgi:hypothetical protein